MNFESMEDRLVKFGLTRQEAILYMALSKEEAVTGYEASKITGISRSNAYNGLAGLTEKGAAYVIEGDSKKYVSVPVEEFCTNKIRMMTEDKKFLMDHMPAHKDMSEGYITIEGYDNILNKARNLMEQAKYRVYISMSAKVLHLIREDIQKMTAEEKRVVIISNKDPKLPGTELYLTEDKGYQVRMIFDSSKVLTGEFGQGHNTCLYSGQGNFVNILKEALSNEIKLIELKKGEQRS